MRILLFFSLWFAGHWAAATEVQALRAWSGPEKTRLVLDLSGPPDYEVFAIGAPERLVVDLADTQLHGPLSLPAAARARILRLRQARHGTSVRLVFDLARKSSYHYVLLKPHEPYGYRLVVDLRDLAPKAVGYDPIAAIAARETPGRTAQSPPSNSGAWRDIVIAIDAGHGGEDPGAIGPRGTHEKDINLKVARELAALVNGQAGMRAVLIRDGDYYVGLRERMRKARQHRADLFISVHADAIPNRRVRGSSVYVLSPRGASSEAARWLAARENASDLVGGVTLHGKDAMVKTTLLDLSQTASLQASTAAAEAVLAALRHVGAVHRTDVQRAGFMVLKSPDIPSLLVETAFISNPQEEQRLGSKKFRRKVAGALLAGLKRYFTQAAPTGTRFARGRQHRVVAGDTLSALALRYAVSMESIKLSNGLDREMLLTGEVLAIP